MGLREEKKKIGNKKKNLVYIRVEPCEQVTAFLYFWQLFYFHAWDETQARSVIARANLTPPPTSHLASLNTFFLFKVGRKDQIGHTIFIVE